MTLKDFYFFFCSYHCIICVFTVCIRELEGVIVWLDELGHVTCSYLGTDPTFFTASTRGKRELNYKVQLDEKKVT